MAAVFKYTRMPKYRAIHMLLYSSELRVSEGLRLKLSDIDRDDGVLRVGKGKGDAALRDLLKSRPSGGRGALAAQLNRSVGLTWAEAGMSH